MNRDKLSIVLGTILILLNGFASGTWAADNNHNAGAPSDQPVAHGAGRDAVNDKLPSSYNDLVKFLSDVKFDGFRASTVALDKTEAKDELIGFSDSEKLLKWAKTFAKYRKGLADCENAEDKSAQLMGALLDKFVAEVSHLAGKTPEEKKISEKKLLSLYAEIKRFLDKKAVKHQDETVSNGSNDTFLAGDKALVEQMDKTLKVLFGENHSDKLKIDEEITKEKAALEQWQIAQTAAPVLSSQPDSSGSLVAPKGGAPVDVKKDKPETIVKDNHELADKAIEVLEKRSGKACKIDLSDDKESEVNKPTPTPTPTSSPTTPTPTPTPTASKPTLSPGPITGNKPTEKPTEKPTDAPTDNPPGNNGGGNNGGNIGGGNNGLGDTQGPPAQNNPNSLQPFDPSAAVANALAPLQDMINALKANDANNDALRRAALDQFNNNRDNGDDTAALLKALLGQQNQQPQIQQQPQQAPQISPPQVNSQPQDNQPPFQPQTADQQQQPPFNPLSMFPPQQPAQPPYYAPESPRRWDDSNYTAAPALPIAPPANPMLDMMRMMAMQQMWQQSQMAARGIVNNVNGLAQRIAGLGPRPVLSRPGGLPAYPNGVATTAGVLAPNARGPLPAVLSVRGGQRAM